MSDNFDALFNISADTVIKEQIKSNSDLYRPSAESGKDNVYKAIIRFLPWHKDPQYKSIIRKWVVWLQNPNTDEAKMVDCPSTINEKSILQDVFFKLYKSPNVQEQELARNFSRREQFYSLVYIIKDENNPDLQGQIKIFRYGKKIYDKLENLIKHPVEPNMPFDIFEGKPFMLHITKQSGFNNYDNSSFLSKPWPLQINGKPVTKEQANYSKILKYLKENSPNLEQYSYKKWDDETKQFVLDTIDAVVPAGKIKSAILSSNKNLGIATSRVSTKSVSKPSSKVEMKPNIEKATDDIDIDIESDSIDDFIEGGVTSKKEDPLADLDLDLETEDDIYSELD